MSRKKSRQNRSEPTRETAVLSSTQTREPEISRGEGTNGKLPATVANGDPGERKAAGERFWLEVIVIRAARWLGSLQVAVLFLGIFALVLAIGTMVESWYSDKIAKELVYRAWWFNLLLLALGVNIFFAAVKKWPWKRHQTGFLITHVGLLTLVAGGLFTSLGGTDTVMALIDTDDSGIQKKVSELYGSQMAQAGTQVSDRETAAIRVQKVKTGNEKSEVRNYPFQSGSLAWRPDQYLQPNLNPLLTVLDWMAHPLPRTWQADLGDGAKLEVLAFYPHVRRERFRPAEPGDTEPFPAVKVSLKSAMFPEPVQAWVAGTGRNSGTSMGGGMIQMLGRCGPELLGEFQHPPAVAEIGAKGQLVLRAGEESVRLDVDKVVGRSELLPLGRSGWKVKITSYRPTIDREADTEEKTATNPFVEFDAITPDGKTGRFAVVGRMPTRLFPFSEGKPGPEFDRLKVWYHPPDQRFGQKEARGVLQFVTAEDHLYYRSFSSATGKFALENGGEAHKGEDAFPIWGGMKWTCQVAEYLPQAANDVWYLPEDMRPGFEDPAGRVKAALRCRLVAGKETKEFWLGRSEEDLTPVTVGGQKFEVGYNDERSDLGFEVKLLKAIQLVDPGTNQPASFESRVQLTDKSENVEAADKRIWMNHPLEHRGYKFFQSGLNRVPLETLKPVNVSIFTVSRDPGLWFKYIGSSMLALGIACMFYMKAYFFKPRARNVPA